MKYTCNNSLKYGDSSWTSDIFLLSQEGLVCEAEISSRGSCFHFITGPAVSGNFLCIINHDIGCELADYSDVFWNREKISHFLNPVDTESLVMGLAQVPLLQKLSEQEVIS